jgi:hypothetical protein
VLLLTLLAFVACFSSRSAAAEPAPHPRSVTFTALPELTPRAIGEIRVFVLPDLPADASAIRKVRHAQATAGLSYLARINAVIRIGSWNHQYFFDVVLMASDVYRVAAELEESPGDRVPWYEERVRALKTLERFTEIRVNFGTAPPQSLSLARFFRYQTEADLLLLKEALAKSGNTRSRPLPTMEFDSARDAKPSTYTAFPDLQPKPAPPKPPERQPSAQPRKESLIPPIPLDVLTTDLPPLFASDTVLRKMQFGRVFATRSYEYRVREVIRIGSWNAYYFREFITNAAEGVRAAAELEELPNRVVWYERTIVLLKEFERFIKNRVEQGTSPPQDLDDAIFHRLQAEAELLQLQAEIVKSGAQPAAPGKRDPNAVEPKLVPDTAFPDLKPPTYEENEVKDPFGRVERIRVEKGTVPLPVIPDPTSDAPLLSRVRFHQVREGLAYFDIVQEAIRIGTWSIRAMPDFTEYLQMRRDVYRVAADLEESLVRRILWHAAQIQAFKEMERYIRIRVELGTMPPQDLDRIQFQRIESEIDLLKLQIAARSVSASSVREPIWYPQACVQPTARACPQLFRR